jgi:hypothetical protein
MRRQLRTLLRCPMRKAWEPGKGDSDHSAIHKVHRQSIMVYVCALGHRFFEFSFRSAHAKPSTGKADCSVTRLSIPWGETRGSFPCVPGPDKTLRQTCPAQRDTWGASSRSAEYKKSRHQEEKPAQPGGQARPENASPRETKGACEAGSDCLRLILPMSLQPGTELFTCGCNAKGDCIIDAHNRSRYSVDDCVWSSNALICS